MAFQARRNLTTAEIAEMIAASKHRAVRTIIDPRSGDKWFWPAELGTHRQGADALKVPYDRPPGGGEILTLD